MRYVVTLLRYLCHMLKWVIAVTTIVGMFATTTYMRYQHNKPESHMERMIKMAQDGKSVSDSAIQFALKMDEDAGQSLYRKIWTYDMLIFLSGALLIYLIKADEDKRSRMGKSKQNI